MAKNTTLSLMYLGVTFPSKYRPLATVTNLYNCVVRKLFDFVQKRVKAKKIARTFFFKTNKRRVMYGL